MQNAPVYTHDCGPASGCRYLGSMTPPGQYTPEGVTQVDLWVHTYDAATFSGNGQRMSLIYRYADDGPEYESRPYWPGDPTNGIYLREHPVFSEVLRRMASA